MKLCLSGGEDPAAIYPDGMSPQNINPPGLRVLYSSYTIYTNFLITRRPVTTIFYRLQILSKTQI